ncbi:MAG: response regulator transcription factor, partial [Elusimicrobiota bacterium]
IDDVESLRKAVSKALAQAGFGVVSAADGSDGLLLAQEAAPDLILCDAVMPGLDGNALLRVLKRGKRTAGIPIIIMSGEMIEEKDVVSGLEGGADDYIAKPFPMKVLLARIRAVLRRYDHEEESLTIQKRCGIALDPEGRTVKVSGEAVELARKEFDLLALLLSRPGRVLKPGFLLEAVWGYDLADYNDPHTVETHISRLRKKLGPSLAKRIVSVRGIGYRFDA